MDGVWGVILISLAMFVGCLVLGIIPLLLNLSEQKLQLITVLGAGLLCGTALSIIIPEGVELVQESWKDWYCSSVRQSPNISESNSTLLPAGEKTLRPHFFIGVSLVMGFVLMFVVDQIANCCSYHESQVRMSGRYSVTATLGLVIHAAADGVALGAAAGSSQVSVQVLVFFAVILHKAPAAFGLVSFLMHAGLERKTIQKHLLVFSAAAPLLAIGTYFILSASNSSSQNRLSATGIGMLFSAGTFLYVATVHVLPEISRRGQQRSSHLHHHTETAGHQQRGLGVMESLTLILGTALPVLLALGLPED
ncbi:zinc transporter ZIP9 isoform X1 [Triplophysa rosa]|uniref:Zinc transporter ZIP9 n=1 Tax=Triplophysa rosa TaxID=992332 RepID=A0A9W8C2E7_TRIRA|nr:zinc transporter ZIP9 isoform X1 [Triplophysa rosa]KAI7805664.1 solute carrier family 39 member 9-1 [Triplophysa rosa]